MRRLFVAFATSLVVSVAVAACGPSPSATSAATARSHADTSPPEQQPLPPSRLTIAIDCAAVRAHPLGARVLALWASFPEWKQLTDGSKLDAMRDVDQVVITGPSLMDDRRDAVVVRYSATDSDVEKAILETTSCRTFVVGVPDIRAWWLWTSGRQRALLRGPEHVLVAAPAQYARAYAQQLSRGALDAHPLGGPVLTLRALAPGRHWFLVPKEVIELRASIVPTADGGMEISAEGDFPDAAVATAAAAELAQRVAALPIGDSERPEAPGRSVECRSEGATVKLRGRLTGAEVEALFDLYRMRVAPRRGR